MNVRPGCMLRSTLTLGRVDRTSLLTSSPRSLLLTTTGEIDITELREVMKKMHIHLTHYQVRQGNRRFHHSVLLDANILIPEHSAHGDDTIGR